MLVSYENLSGSHDAMGAQIIDLCFAIYVHVGDSFGQSFAVGKNLWHCIGLIMARHEFCFGACGLLFAHFAMSALN